jgi:small subunit ribosomal protein S6
MRTYELVSIFDPGLETEAIELNLGKIQDLIIAGDGIIRKWERWGKRRLTYEIQAKQYGYYVLVVFDVNPSQIAEMDRLVRINPSVIRHLITVVDPKRVPEIDIESVKTMGAMETPPDTLEPSVAPIDEIEGLYSDIDIDLENLPDAEIGEDLKP